MWIYFILDCNLIKYAIIIFVNSEDPDCVDPDVDLGLRWPHMPEDTFSYSAGSILRHPMIMQAITKTHLFQYIENLTTQNWKFSNKKNI